jgi:GMP synthase (glutamine-hydrolysing)
VTPTDPKQALVIRHVAFEDLRSFEPVLAERGFRVRYVEAAGDLSDADGLEPALVIVLGGPIGAYEDAIYPFLKHELRFLERRLAADRPTLGICLGAQLMARALGARVYAGRARRLAGRR